MHPIIRKVPSRNLPAAAPSVPIRANRNNQHAHADNRAAGNSHRNEASNAHYAYGYVRWRLHLGD